MTKYTHRGKTAPSEEKPKQKRIKNKEKYLPKGNKQRKMEEKMALKKERADARRAEKAAAAALAGEAKAADEDEEAQVSPAVVELLPVQATESEEERLKREKKARKEEKRRLKEAKRSAKDAAVEGMGAPAVGASEVEREDIAPPAESSPPATEVKKDKKKKRQQPAVDDGESAQPAEPATATNGDQPKKKRNKSLAHEPSTSTPASAPASGTATLTSTPTPAFAASSEEITAYLTENNITLHPAYPSPSTPSPILHFPQLPIHPQLLAALAKFSNPTPIQACAWPALLEGRDVVGIAETGSGKTLAFGLPALQRLVAGSEKSEKKSKSKGKAQPQVLVVAPTRELAIQTHDTLLALSQPFGLSSVCVFGGVSKQDQIKQLSSASAKIVVGTPGRLLDLAREGNLNLGEVGYLVLDEADRMLDRGFEPDIRAIVEMCKEQGERQTAMFSATWPDSVRRLAASFQRDPFRITVGAEDLSANKRVSQSVEVLENSYDKDARLRSLLQSLKHKTSVKAGTVQEEERTLIFVLYKKEATRVEQSLGRWGYRAAAIHGDMGQHARIQALDEFKLGKVKLLVATDVAARGLDIPNVGTVVNYSFPLTIEDYIHRIGRTGRGGASGKSVTFFTGEAHEKALAGELMRVLRDAGFEVPQEMSKFPSTIRKKEHATYGAFFKEGVDMDKKGKKITFD